MFEHFFNCPYCMAEISILIDPSIRTQKYIENCEVCCNPIQVQLEMENGTLLYFQALSIEQ
ncbi:Cysteine-rich CPXCG [Aquiflexum balticum DSM 16537]|uniref:Cysteine-rich CPXCG n=1 Tax=Aquiflexum balticum DSM 16537 TaxID=758820 RepID=A0A1W2GYS4_9BACT|nr:Cysteine-rich CPXCG [Aquiflexum balticum DSM 16537]